MTARAQAIPPALWIAPAAMLLLALLPMPYGYYVLLRLVVCLAGGWLAWRLLSADREAIAGWLLVGCVILYNPVIRVPLEREVWMAVNLLTAGLFWWAGRRRRGDRL